MKIPWRPVARWDDDYPLGLGDLSDAPPVLYVQGCLPRGGVAIIGSRDVDEEAADFAFEVARSLGTAVISGLARGVDAAAHRGALAAGLPTLAYVGTGIDRVYPPEHRELAAQIVITGGGIASEQPIGRGATPATLIQRDRLQAAHARALLLIVTEAEGGAMHTMRFGRELGRPLFALVPRTAGDDGNRRAIEAGARALPWDVQTVRSQLAQGLG
jgi:DNA processing protein